jgi:hypothetical protein
MSSDTMPVSSNPPAHNLPPAPTVASDGLALPRLSISMPADDGVNLPSTTATISPSDDMRTWPLVKMHPGDATAYLEHEIYLWFLDQGIDKNAEIDQEEMVSTLVVCPPSYDISDTL